MSAYLVVELSHDLLRPLLVQWLMVCERVLIPQ